MVRSFSRSFSLVTAIRVMLTSAGTTGSTLRAKVSCTGPRTWPQFTSVAMTAPKVRMSKKFSHIQAVTARASSAFLGSFLDSDFSDRAV